MNCSKKGKPHVIFKVFISSIGFVWGRYEMRSWWMKQWSGACGQVNVGLTFKNCWNDWWIVIILVYLGCIGTSKLFWSEFVWNISLVIVDIVIQIFHIFDFLTRFIGSIPAKLARFIGSILAKLDTNYPWVMEWYLLRGDEKYLGLI